jgi:hypothetical protein
MCRAVEEVQVKRAGLKHGHAGLHGHRQRAIMTQLRSWLLGATPPRINSDFAILQTSLA